MLYDIVFFIFSVFYLPTLLFKGKLHRDFLERFGIYDKNKLARLQSDKKKIWIQAVSVGEVALCKSLIPQLQKKYEGYEIVLSTITKAGNDLAKKIYAESAAIIYFPIDFSFVASKVVNIIKPKLFIMVETEVWPNVLKALSDKRVPSILINGRISDSSFGKYRLAKQFLKNILNKINLFAMQSRRYADRITALGAPPDKVKVTGNMKFDAGLTTKPDRVETIRESLELKGGEELFVAGSTHKGEDEILIEVFQKLTGEFPHLRLLIAPRHIERSGEIERLARQFGFEPVRISFLKLKTYNLQLKTIFILDTIGQLNDVYSVAALVFIGGSLVRHGGHNPIEPAMFEKPILFGPHMFNFRNIADIFLKNNAAVQVLDKKDLYDRCKVLLQDKNEKIRLGQNAKRTVLENRGATERNLKMITEIL